MKSLICEPITDPKLGICQGCIVKIIENHKAPRHLKELMAVFKATIAGLVPLIVDPRSSCGGRPDGHTRVLKHVYHHKLKLSIYILKVYTFLCNIHYFGTHLTIYVKDTFFFEMVKDTFSF